MCDQDQGQQDGALLCVWGLTLPETPHVVRISQIKDKGNDLL